MAKKGEEQIRSKDGETGEKYIFEKSRLWKKKETSTRGREKDRKKKEIIDEKENGRIKRSRRMETKG